MWQASSSGHRHRRLEALERVLERDPHLDLDVRPALAALRAAAAAAAAASAAEEPAEDVAEVEVAEVDVGRPRPAVGRAEGVVLLALLGIGEDVVGLLDLLEPLLGLGIARVVVRVVLAGELPVGLLQVVGGGVLGDARVS